MVASLAGQAAFGQSEPVPPDSWARRQEIAQLGEITPNVAADFDPLLGTPTFIRSTTAFLTRRSGRTAAQIVADFVNDNPATFGVSLAGGNLIAVGEFPNATYRVLRDFETPSLGPTGVRHLTYQQTHNGQDIYGCLLTANVTGDGMLVNIGSRFVTEPGSPITPSACDEANRTVRDVVAAACDEVNDTRIADIVNLIAPEAVCAFDWKDGQAFQGVGETALWVRSVLHAVSAGELVQAWVVRLPANPDQDDAAWECMVKHSDLSVLSTHDLTMHFCQPEPVTYRVYTDDSPVPGTPGLATTPALGEDTECTMRALLPRIDDCGNPLNDTRELVTVTAADVLPWSPFGWLNEGATWLDHSTNPPTVRPGFEHCFSFNGGTASQTCGNNIRCYKNGTFRDPVVGPGRVFDSPGAESDAAVGAQVFADANRWHDLMYQLGFDEVAGNFQSTNLGQGGVEDDPLDIWFRDGVTSGYGATLTILGVSEDGGQIVTKMGVAPSGTAGRWSAPDRTVLFHELTHAMSVRLYVGTLMAGSGLQGAGLFEGWGDYFAVAITAQPGDDMFASYPVFSYPSRPATGQLHHYYYGARTFPFTARNTDYDQVPIATNPLRYGHVRSNAPLVGLPVFAKAPASPHFSYFRSDKYGISQVWTTALIHCRYELSLDPGVEDANWLLMQLSVDSMKLSPAGPNYVQARDALLQADMLRCGGVHQPRLWAAMAARGLGFGATSPNGAATTDIVESLDMPPANDVSIFFPDDVPATIHTCTPTTVEAFIVAPANPIGDVWARAQPDPGVIGLPALVTPTMPGYYEAVIDRGPCGQAWEFWLEVALGPSQPPVVRESRRFAIAAGETAEVLNDQMELWDGLWTGTVLSAPYPPSGPYSTADAGRPVRVDPNGGHAVHPARDATPGAGRFCWATQQHPTNGRACGLADDVDSDAPGASLASGQLDIPANRTALVELWLWYASVDGAATDTNTPQCIGGPGSANDVECVVEWLSHGQVVASKSFTRESADTRWQRVRMTADTADGEDQQLRIRFIDPPPDSGVEGGVDDVVISVVLDCVDCCDGDMDADGSVNQDDVAYLIVVVGGGENPSGVDPDFNHDGNVDQDDVAALINYVSGAGCP